MRPFSALGCKYHLIPILYFLTLSPLALAETVINPQVVVDRVLSEGRQARTIELEAQGAYTNYYNTFGIYDLGFTGRASYEDTRIHYLSGAGNLRDRNTVWSAVVSKRVPTGTTLQFGYNRTLQNSMFRTTVSTLRPPYVAYDVAELTITQDLLGNFFGIAERMNNRAAEQNLESAGLLLKERQEQLVLDSLRQFWDTYVAREALREAISQRDKYEALVKEVQNKSRLGFSSPGDLPKARAEFGAQVRNVKQASFNYLHNLDVLLTAMRMEDADRNVRFEVKEELPPLPTMVMPQVDSLRTVQMNQTQFDAAELTRRATRLSVNWPELRLIGTAGFTGLDGEPGRAFSGVTRGDRPRYMVALEMNYKFFSNGYRGRLNASDVGAEQAFNNLLQSKENLRQQISTAMENVRYTYAAALSAIEETKEWEAAVKAQENSYRQGRLDFSQLIQDYNRYYQSRATRIRAIGNYQLALHNYAAAVDSLVE